MKPITGKRLAQEIEKICGEDLDKIEQKRGSAVLGIPRKVVVLSAVMAAERRLDLFSEEIKGTFRNRKWMAENASKRIKNLSSCNEVCAFVGLPESLKAQAESLGKCSNNLGEYLREHGRKDHDQAIPILVGAILKYQTSFDCWKELARVIRVAYIAGGRVSDADQIKADTLHKALLRAAEQYKTEKEHA